MIHKEQDGIKWLEFLLLQDFSAVRHGVFLRHGGVSEGSFGSLNVSLSVGDDRVLVEENRRRLKQRFPAAALVFASQVHGDHISRVNSDDFLEEPCDGLMTNKAGKALVISHADCQAALFYDPQNHILANVHCGWRGNVQNIYGKAVEMMRSMGSNPSDILVCLSPSLGPRKAEFMHYEQELPCDFWAFRRGRNHFDLWAISQDQLRKAGILPSHIEIAEICTYENEQDYFSYRRERITGRHATIAQLL